MPLTKVKSQVDSQVKTILCNNTPILSWTIAVSSRDVEPEHQDVWLLFLNSAILFCRRFSND